MKKTMMLAKISLKYWANHKMRLFTLMLTLVFGVSALCCTALLIRSEKHAVLENALMINGNYDYVIYCISEKTAERIAQDECVDDLGMQYDLGYVKSESGAKEYAAAYLDEKSEDFDHMPCTRGHYPRKEDEVAMDLTSAAALGVKPYPGEKVTLSLYSADDKHLADKQYTLSGIFEKQNPSVYGGWQRYDPKFEESGYNMQGVYFHASQNDIFKSDTVAAFILSGVEPGDWSMYERIKKYAEPTMLWGDSHNRKEAYTYVLGVFNQIWSDEYGSETYSNINSIMDKGGTVKDFYSGVLMPVFTVIIFIIVILSVVGITRNIIKDKQENFAVLRSLGLERRQLKLYVFCDFTVTALVCIAIGLLLGSAVHMIMINSLNSICDLRLQYGFTGGRYVDDVTLDPFILSSVTMIICVEFAVFLSLFGIRGKTPIQMFEDKYTKKRRHRRQKPAGKYHGWKLLLVRRIKLRSFRIAVISILVMSCALFGYTYFNALADKNNAELRWEKEQSGLTCWDYTAQKSKHYEMYKFNIENRHDLGVSIDSYGEMKGKPFVEDAFAKMTNRSTRLVYGSNELDENALSVLKDYDTRLFGDKDMSKADAVDKANKDGEDAMVKAVGYRTDDHIYACPSVGLFDDELEKLKSKVVDGRIDVKKLNDGSEVLLVLTSINKDKLLPLFKVGDKLPLSDILLSNSEEQLDFNRNDITTYGEPVYNKDIIFSDGTKTPYMEFAFGRRKDISTRIGAIAVLNEEDADKYMSMAGEQDCGMNVFCSVNAFGAWGLKDRNLTAISMKLKDGTDISEADEYWYSVISGGKGMTSRSTSQITAGMNRGTKKIMSVYYSMMIILTLTAAAAIAITLYTDIRIRSKRFASLRACGMSTGQILFMILRQNIVYPIIGAGFSLLPVIACSKLFGYIIQKVESGQWTSAAPQWAEQGQKSVPWIADVPYIYDLFSYNVPRAVVILFVIYLALILLVTLPQIRFIRRQPIVEEIEKSSF